MPVLEATPHENFLRTPLIIGNFMAYQDRLETNVFQQFANQENSEWFSIISVIVFEINIIKETSTIGTTFSFFISFHCPQLF